MFRRVVPYVKCTVFLWWAVYYCMQQHMFIVSFAVKRSVLYPKVARTTTVTLGCSKAVQETLPGFIFSAQSKCMCTYVVANKLYV